MQSQKRLDEVRRHLSAIPGYQLHLSEAQATAGFGDDLKVLGKIQAALKAQIKATGSTVDLQQQLFDTVQQIKSTKTSALVAKDFKLLGLGPTGDALVPGKAHLKKLLQSVVDSIGGTSLDTSKVKNQLKVIRKELTQSFVPPEIRTEMQSLLANLEGQLKTAGNQLGFKQLDTSALAKTFGLSGLDERRLEAKLSQIGKGGTVPNTGVGAFGVGVPAGSSAGGRGLTITPSTVVVKIDEKEIGQAAMDWKIGHDRRNPSQRRGPSAGR